MMKTIGGFLLMVVGMTGLARAQDSEHPYKSAKVGDYVVHKMTGAQTLILKKEITATNDKEVTLKTSMSLNGKEFPGNEIKIDLTKKYDIAEQGGGAKVKITELGKGEETIKVKDKDYKCQWRSFKSSFDAGGKEFTTEVKVWTSKEVPLDGLVKYVIQSMGTTNTMELEEVGSKKK
jgi:hypothetical protein